jgi:hypothetical protein
MSGLSYELLKGKLFEISKIVNAFNSESLQKQVFNIFIKSILSGDKNLITQDDTDETIDLSNNNALKKKKKVVAIQGGNTARPNTGKRRGEHKPSFVKNLNLRPTGKKSLKVFIDEKRPKDNQERYAVIVYYFKKLFSIDKVGLDHIYTAFKEIDKPVPNNIRGGITVTAARKGWIDTGDVEDIKLAIPGENFVEHDLPKKKPVRDK